MWMALYDVGGKTVLCLFVALGSLALAYLITVFFDGAGRDEPRVLTTRVQISDCVARDPSRFSDYRSSRNVQIALDRLSGLNSR